MTAIETTQQNPVYKQIMADSFGGIMYDVANRGKYDTAERESAGGIMGGAFNFIKEMEA